MALPLSKDSNSYLIACLGKHFPGRFEHAPGRKSKAMSSGLLPAL